MTHAFDVPRGTGMTATPEQVAEARAWASDCAWKEDPEELALYDDAEIVAGVEHHYDGGWAAFVRDALLDPEAGDDR